MKSATKSTVCLLLPGGPVDIVERVSAVGDVLHGADVDGVGDGAAAPLGQIRDLLAVSEVVLLFLVQTGHAAHQKTE